MVVAIKILRVFVNNDNKFGNPVGIIQDEKRVLETTVRQVIATRLNFSESVFIDNAETGTVSIYNPKKEVNFAGHALVGTSYFLKMIRGHPLRFLVCKAGQLETYEEKGLTWIRSSLKGTPPWHHAQLQDAYAIENMPLTETKKLEHTVLWAWMEQNKGMVRARTFASDWGIPEDEANGSGSMQLASMLGCELEIHHGKGSVIYAKPTGDGFADVGGRVVQDQSQEIMV